MPGLLSQPRQSLFGTSTPATRMLRDVTTWKPPAQPPAEEAIRKLLFPHLEAQQSPIARMFPPPWATVSERPADTVARRYGIGKRTDNAKNVGPGVARNPYTAGNLNLGANAIYRDAIVSAAQRTHRDPRILAAIVNREAHRGADGVWDPRSSNEDHVGLAQFGSNTWIGETERRGTYLNQTANRLGYLDRRGRVLPQHRIELLNLRNDPASAINATADYAEHNIASMREHGLITDLTPEAEAGYAYYAHQNGLGGAEDLLRGRRRANEHLYRRNVPRGDQERYLQQYGPDWGHALSAYMRDHILGADELNQFGPGQARPNQGGRPFVPQPR